MHNKTSRTPGVQTKEALKNTRSTQQGGAENQQEHTVKICQKLTKMHNKKDQRTIKVHIKEPLKSTISTQQGNIEKQYEHTTRNY